MGCAGSSNQRVVTPVSIAKTNSPVLAIQLSNSYSFFGTTSVKKRVTVQQNIDGPIATQRMDVVSQTPQFKSFTQQNQTNLVNPASTAEGPRKLKLPDGPYDDVNQNIDQSYPQKVSIRVVPDEDQPPCNISEIEDDRDSRLKKDAIENLQTCRNSCSKGFFSKSTYKGMDNSGRESVSESPEINVPVEEEIIHVPALTHARRESLPASPGKDKNDSFGLQLRRSLVRISECESINEHSIRGDEGFSKTLLTGNRGSCLSNRPPSLSFHKAPSAFKHAFIDSSRNIGKDSKVSIDDIPQRKRRAPSDNDFIGQIPRSGGKSRMSKSPREVQQHSVCWEDGESPEPVHSLSSHRSHGSHS